MTPLPPPMHRPHRRCHRISPVSRLSESPRRYYHHNLVSPDPHKKDTVEKEFFKEYGEASPYAIQEVIVKGSYGVVASAIDIHTKEVVATKKINDVFEHVSNATRILREIKLLRLLHHPAKVFHHDVKAKDILANADCNLKICVLDLPMYHLMMHHQLYTGRIIWQLDGIVHLSYTALSFSKSKCWRMKSKCEMRKRL